MVARNIGAFRVKTNLASNPGSQFTNRVTLEKSPGISLDFKIHLQNEGATHRMCGKIKQGNDCEESTTAPVFALVRSSLSTVTDIFFYRSIVVGLYVHARG